MPDNAIERAGRRSNLLRSLSIASLSLLLIVFLARAWRYGKSQAGIDYYQYWVIGRVIRSYPDESLYSDEARTRLALEYLKKSGERGSSPQFRAAAERRQRLETYSTPFLYTVFSLISSGDYALGHRRYLLLCLLFGGGGIIGFCRMLRYSLIGTLAALILTLSWFGPFWSDITVANVNQVQLGLLALFSWVQSRNKRGAAVFLGGIILGFAFMFKPNLLFVAGLSLISYLLSRRYKELTLQSAGLLTSIAAAFLLSSLRCGSLRCWHDWAGAVKALPDNVIGIDLGNLAAATLIRGWTGVNATPCLTLLFGGITVFCFLRGRAGKESPTGKTRIAPDDRREETGGPLFLAGAGCLIYLLSARLVWFHYYLLTIPSALIVFRPRKKPCRASSFGIAITRLLGAGAILLIAVTPTAVLLGLREADQQALLVNAGLLTLFLLTVRELSEAQG